MTKTEEKNTLIEYSIRAIATIISAIILFAYFFISGSTVHAQEYTNYVIGTEQYHYVNGNSDYYITTTKSISGENIGVVAYKGGNDGYTEDYILYYIYCIDSTKPVYCDKTASVVYTGTAKSEDTINASTISDAKLITESYEGKEYSFYRVDWGALGYNYGDTEWGYSNVVVNCPFFENKGCALSYIVNGSIDGMISSGLDVESPDLSDDAYKLKNFTCDNSVKATWSGTTDRSYLLNSEVHEHVKVYKGYSYYNVPTQIALREEIPELIETSSGGVSYDWDSLQKDGVYLRYLQFYPIYSVSEGIFGVYFVGEPCTIYYNPDGSIEKIDKYEPDYTNYKHDFSKDKYIKSIPIPELGNITHNGFTVLNNNDGKYYIDIIAENRLYGVNLKKITGSWLPVVDNTWVYYSDYYNFTDISDIAYNNSVIDIPSMYNTNMEQNLINAFMAWSKKYPEYYELPTYSLFKGGTSASISYRMSHVYDSDSTVSDKKQLADSCQAETVYYVRFYDKDMNYGMWAKYTFIDGSAVVGGSITVGQLDTDEDGKIITDKDGNPSSTDSIHGVQDYESGITDYTDSDFDMSIDGVDDFFDYIGSVFNNIKTSINSFGGLLNACFSFLPDDIIGLIITGIVIMVFVGIVKAVI